MKRIHVLLLPAIVLAVIFNADVSRAQLSLSQVSSVQAADYAVTLQGADWRVWQKTVVENGVSRVHQYTELATGLNYWQNGQWAESQEKIVVQPDGTAAATQGQHQAYFPGDIYSGQIKLVTPDGLQLKSRPVGLSYDDGTNTVLFAVLTNSAGQVLGDNQVIYINAFTGLTADLLYTYTKSSFEQDVILRQQPPTPESLGLNPGTARLQILTEFFSPPQPTIKSAAMPRQAGLSLTDESLAFGRTKMVPGRAFLLGTNATDAGALVGKQWVQFNGRQFLVESVPVDAIAAGLATLPLTAMNSNSSRNSFLASKHLALPAKHVTSRLRPEKIRRASIRKPDARGFVLDYQTLNSNQTNYTFQGDTTYYVSGNFSLFGTNIFEGGTVIKYGANKTISSSATVVFKTGPYRPAVFTSKNDNTVGETISGSTGSPSGYSAVTALSFSDIATQSVSGVRILYARAGIGGFDTALRLTNAQFVDCLVGVSAVGGETNVVDNALFANCITNFSLPVNDKTAIQANQDTFANALALLNFDNPFTTDVRTRFGASPDGAVRGADVSLYLTNCVLANVTNVDGVTAAGINGFYQTPEFGDSPVTNNFYPFQTVGAGGYYLANGGAFFNAGTPNLDPALLANLANKTTYPPLIYTNATIYVNTNFTPQAARDISGPPDLGYHYDPIDYYTEQYTVVSATLTVSGGTVIVCNNDNGIWLGGGSAINCIGTDTTPNWLTYYLCVQEEPVALGPYAPFTVCPDADGGKPVGVFQFTKFTQLADEGYEFYDEAGPYLYGGLLIQNCEFWNGWVELDGPGSSATVVQNNLFARAPVDAVDDYFTYEGNYSLSFSNNLFWHLAFEVDQNSTGEGVFFNNDFDSCGFSYGGSNASTTNGYNAYLNCSGRLSPTNANDIVLTNSLAYQTGLFGDFYQPTNSPLIDKGSTTVAGAGLSGYTTQTNLLLDTNTVDIGLHYYATFLDLTAQCNTNGAGVELYWSLDALAQQISGDISDFNIYRGTVSGGPYILIDNTDATETNYLDLGATPGDTYYYLVTCNYYGSHGVYQESPPSNEAAITLCLPPPLGTNGVDVVFILDNTASIWQNTDDGSMGVYQDAISNSLAYIEYSFQGGCRFALVTPDTDGDTNPTNDADDDTGHDMVDVRIPLTNSIAAFAAELMDTNLSAIGGSIPESTDQCLNTVVNALPAFGRTNDDVSCTRPDDATPVLQIGDFSPKFRTNAVKLVVLITDAPPSGFCDSDAYPYDASYETYAHTYALEAATNHIKINAIQISNDSNAQTVMQDYSATSCGWYSQLGYFSNSGDIEVAILNMLYSADACH